MRNPKGCKGNSGHHNGQQLAYVYFEDELAAKLLTKDEARRIAAKFAWLPELLHPILAKPNSQHG